MIQRLKKLWPAIPHDVSADVCRAARTLTISYCRKNKLTVIMIGNGEIAVFSYKYRG